MGAILEGLYSAVSQSLILRTARRYQLQKEQTKERLCSYLAKVDEAWLEMQSSSNFSNAAFTQIAKSFTVSLAAITKYELDAKLRNEIF